MLKLAILFYIASYIVAAFMAGMGVTLYKVLTVLERRFCNG